MNAHHVRASQQLVLGDERRPHLGGSRGGEVLAPGDHVHLERAADLGHARAQPAESDDAEGLAVQTEPAAHLPPALARGAILDRDAAGEREDQAPRQLGRRIGEPRGPADDDPTLHGRAHLDGRVAHSRRHQELEPRQLLEERARKRGPLTHGHHRVEVGESSGHRADRTNMVGKDHQLGPRGETRPVGHATGNALIVVQDRDTGHARLRPCY